MRVNYIFSFFIALTINQTVFAQKSYFSYSINGKVNTDSCQAFLIPIFDSSFYPSKNIFKEVEIKKGKFNFKGTASYPIAVMLGIKKGSIVKYISDVFWIVKGVQEITCNIDSIRKVPSIDNKQMAEFKNEYIPAFYQTKDSINKKAFLVAYTQEHPNSYVALWKLIKKFSLTGYLPEYDSTFQYFSASIKNSYTGRTLEKKLTQTRSISIGNYFPNLQLIDKQLKKVHLLNSKRNARFILLDFWFSHCAPCIAGFPDLKKLYETYHQKGFEIIGISVDGDERISDWKKVIEENKLSWIQYLDKNGITSKPLAITSFPTLFLLDSNGKIITTDITVSDLEQFLKEHL